MTGTHCIVAEDGTLLAYNGEPVRRRCALYGGFDPLSVGQVWESRAGNFVRITKLLPDSRVEVKQGNAYYVWHSSSINGTDMHRRFDME